MASPIRVRESKKFSNFPNPPGRKDVAMTDDELLTLTGLFHEGLLSPRG